LRQIISNSDFNVSHSFLSVLEMNPPLYYVMNYNGKSILVYNEFWEYQRKISISYSPTYSINVNGVIYVTSGNLINKYDKYFNLTKQLNTPGSNRGIYYNALNKMIYVVSQTLQNILVLDENLNLNSNLTTVYQPWLITMYNGEMVVGDNNNGNVYFYQNYLLVQNISTQCTGRVSSILFDTYNHMLVLCESNNYLYIHHLNGTFTGISNSTCNKPTFMNFDSKDRLIAVCRTEIYIYY
jgi:hypothetical protein